MSTVKIKTYPDLSLSSKKHQDALLNGKEHFFTSNNNVEDMYYLLYFSLNPDSSP